MLETTQMEARTPLRLRHLAYGGSNWQPGTLFRKSAHMCLPMTKNNLKIDASSDSDDDESMVTAVPYTIISIVPRVLY